VTLTPLLNASSIIQIHAFAAMATFAIGLVQLTAPKGTIPHRLIGWSWVLLMLTVAISSFFIHIIRLWGAWSPIHLLSILVLVSLPLAVFHARRHEVRRHRNAMTTLFMGALVIAGIFTFLPGRIMHAVAFGP
jgi:uncharacterized membrane protein